MKVLIFWSILAYAYAKIYGPSSAPDEPFEAHNGLFYENAAIESGETFTEDRLEQELLHSITPSKAFKGTIVTRERTLPPATRPIEKETIAFVEDIPAEVADEPEGSADFIPEEKADNATINMKMKKSSTELPIVLGLSSPIFSHSSPESENEKSTTAMIDITSGFMENASEDKEGSGENSGSQESSFPFDLEGFGEVPINSKSILIGESESEESSENLKVVKVSGEIGEDPAVGSDKELTETTTGIQLTLSKVDENSAQDIREELNLLEKKPASSGTFLEDNLLPVFLRKKSMMPSNRVAAQRGAIEGCPPPELCAKNCFIALDFSGCQTCECLWQALTCETNDDCPEAIQVCDLGKCECSQGYEQDMTRSGMCKSLEIDVIVHDDAAVVQSEKLFEEAAKTLPDASNSKTKKHNESLATTIPVNLYYGKKHVRVIRATDKLRRPERLQWPGPCDTREHCPPPLHCLQGDCWYLPDKPIRRRSRSRQRDSIPDSFIISNDDDDEEYDEGNLHDGQFAMPSTTTNKPRGLLRFVTEDAVAPNKLRTERTTLIPPTTDVFEISSRSLNSLNSNTTSTPLHPDTVKILGETTRTEPVISDILNNDLESFGSPPAPPPMEMLSSLSPPIADTHKSIGSVSRDKITRTFKLTDEQVADMTKAFTKSIELPKTEVLKPILKKRRKQVKEERPKARGVETVTEPNELEFPISTQLRKLKEAGHDVAPPPALSAKPTSEELEGHVQFMKAMNEQRRRVQLQFERKVDDFSKKEDFLDYEEPSTTTIATTTTTTNLLMSNEVQKAGVWYDMENPIIQRSQGNERRRAPVATTPPRLYMEYTERNMRGKPIRVEGRVVGNFHDECVTDKDCGVRFKCCPKQWCDESSTCGKAKFCLPNCTRTKMVNVNRSDKSLLDIVYD